MADDFPILQSRRRSIPWAMIAPHEAQALRNHDQTLKRLAERGGLGAMEAIAVLEDRRWREVKALTEREADDRLDALVEQFLGVVTLPRAEIAALKADRDRLAERVEAAAALMRRFRALPHMTEPGDSTVPWVKEFTAIERGMDEWLAATETT